MASYFNPQPKTKNQRNKGYRKHIETYACINPKCGEARDGYIASHHCRHLGSGGMALKPPDYHCIPLCSTCHNNVHRHGIGCLNIDMEYILNSINGYLIDYIQILQEEGS